MAAPRAGQRRAGVAAALRTRCAHTTHAQGTALALGFAAARVRVYLRVGLPDADTVWPTRRLAGWTRAAQYVRSIQKWRQRLSQIASNCDAPRTAHVDRVGAALLRHAFVDVRRASTAYRRVAKIHIAALHRSN